MSRSSRPNWEAKVASKATGVYHVFDANGSGRAYSVRLTANGGVWSAINVTRGKTKALDPSGPTARMLASIIRTQCARQGVAQALPNR